VISKPKLLRETLLRNRKLLCNIGAAIGEGVALVDASGYVLYANRAEARILGLPSARKRIGQPFYCPGCSYRTTRGEPLRPEDQATGVALQRKRRFTHPEVQIVRADGSQVWCAITAIPFVNQLSEVSYIAQITHDITGETRLREELERSVAQIIWAREEERKRLSRELHDETAQSLALLILELDSLCSRKGNLVNGILSKLIKLRETAQRTLNEVRRYSHELRPSLLDNLGLASALESIVEDLGQESQINVNFKEKGEVCRLPDQVELTLFRIAQEALTNIRKHSQATLAKISLEFTDKKIKLHIVDNGVGFTEVPSQQLTSAGHLGLVGMRERASLVQGKLQIQSQPGRGTRISIEVPRSITN
jgi:two-component system, NarL family, sensor histidine kinase DegS